MNKRGKQKHKNNFRIVERFAEPGEGVPTFEDILYSEKFKEIFKSIIIDYADHHDNKKPTRD